MTRILYWDIDGTLLSTARAGIFAWEQAALDVLGARVDFEDLDTAGRTDSQIAESIIGSLAGDASAPRRSALLRSYESHLPDRLGWRQGHVLPNVREILADVSQRNDVVNLLLTGNTLAGATAKLRHYELSSFFTASDGGLLGAFCADGDDRDTIALRALRVAGDAIGSSVDGSEAVVIGDTPHDVRCGGAIGARTLAVATGVFGVPDLEKVGAWRVVQELPSPAPFLALVGLEG